MGVFESLVEEHRILEGLVRSMRRGKASRALALLGPAIEEHEEIEEAVLGIPTYATQKGSRRALEAAAAGHAAIERKIKEARSALARPDKERASLSRKIESLSQLLLSHFKLEERELWPQYRRSWRKMSPSVHRFFRSTIDHRIRDLERARRELRRRGP